MSLLHAFPSASEPFHSGAFIKLPGPSAPVWLGLPVDITYVQYWEGFKALVMYKMGSPIVLSDFIFVGADWPAVPWRYRSWNITTFQTLMFSRRHAHFHSGVHSANLTEQRRTRHWQ